MFKGLLLNLRRALGLGWRQKPGSYWEPVCPPLRQDEGATLAPVPSPSHAPTPDPSPLSALSCPLSTADQTHLTLGCSTGIQAWIRAGHPCPALDLHPFVRACSGGALLEMLACPSGTEPGLPLCPAAESSTGCWCFQQGPIPC